MVSFDWLEDILPQCADITGQSDSCIPNDSIYGSAHISRGPIGFQAVYVTRNAKENLRRKITKFSCLVLSDM